MLQIVLLVRWFGLLLALCALVLPLTPAVAQQDLAAYGELSMAVPPATDKAAAARMRDSSSLASPMVLDQTGELNSSVRGLMDQGAVPSTVDADYKITPSDLLDIKVFGVSELDRTVRVNSSGQISLPLIGALTVKGLTPADAEALIAIEYQKQDYLQDPQVSIFVQEFTTQRVTLDGALAKPGVYPLTGQITLLRALAMAGGAGSLADMENVVLFRMSPDGEKLTQTFDVLKIRKGEAPDPVLRNDDLVVVNRNSARVTFRDSLFRDVIDTLNPFSASYNRMSTP